MTNNKMTPNERKNLARKIAKESIMYGSDPHKNNRHDRLDRFLAHPVYGLLVFFGVMWLVFSISQVWVGPIIAELLDGWIGNFANWVSSLTESWHPLASGVIVEGAIGGFAAVVGFVPLIMILFFLLGLLEDSGYMARVAVVFDRYLKKIGLGGKSIIPMYVGTGCAVPAIASARTIRDKKQRRVTILLTPFIPCGAKLPVIALFIGAFFSGSALFTALAYVASLFMIIAIGFIIKLIVGADFSKVKQTYTIVELPEYKLPSVSRSTRATITRAMYFIKNAATIIMIANTLIWLLTSINFSGAMVDSIDSSILGIIVKPIEPIFGPIGIQHWGLIAAALIGFVAKEEVVGALAVIYGFSQVEFEVQSVEQVRIALQAVGVTSVVAFAYMSFNLFTPPCFAAIGAMRTELKSTKWLIFAIAMQLIAGYTIAMIIYQLFTPIITGELGNNWWLAIILLGALSISVVVLNRLAKNGRGLAVLDK